MIGIIVAAAGLGGGILITQQIKQAEEKAAQAERDKQEAERKRVEAERKIAEEEKRQKELEQQRVEAERQRLASEAAQARQERQRLAAERRRLESLASQASSVMTRGNSGGSSMGWQSTCGDPYVAGYSWWAVKGPASALSTIKNNYCGDALIVKGETQVASFRSESDAWSFANNIGSSSGYNFWVKKSSR